MIDGKSVLAVIPARGGSKGVPRKNIRNVAGRPLISWTISAARESRYLDRTILSSEDPEVIALAGDWGCEVPFIRPHELARDETPGIEPALHALSALKERYAYIVLLQPTSPLRTAVDIDECLRLCLDKNAPACVSVTVPDKSPYWMYVIDSKGKLQPVLADKAAARRQDLPQIYSLNGAVYAAECEWLEMTRTFITPDTAAYIMPPERSFDIDSELDSIICEHLLNRRLSV